MDPVPDFFEHQGFVQAVTALNQRARTDWIIDGAINPTRERPLTRLVSVRGFEDTDNIALVLHARLALATSRPAGSGRTRKPPCLIAGLIPTAEGPMSQDMRQALIERQ
ncbi:hypothetical protein [Bifidobacterium psychraerophilum]|uniref:hypothetical protein n=1 Tax=Bifidobacterium psychraerophilum TaxID=218140 RepID=UPI0039E9E3B8